jgi:phospholipid/cholesterol/gamma-HCH transport system substrate-binding protein
MITRIAKLQVLAFLVLSLAGVAFVGLRYVGLGDRLFGHAYLLHADLATAGGIFPNAPVTYRGVPVGRVDAVRLHTLPDGTGAVRADLHMDGGVRVPADLVAVVAERSAVGEQYLDLRPNTDAGPYLRDGDVIPVSRTRTPLPVESLLSGLDSLVSSVDTQRLAVLIDELGKAFEGNAGALRTILDATDHLVTGAQDYLPQTRTLIQDGHTVLDTQVASADSIRRWAAALAQLTATLRGSDADLRRLLAAGPPAATELVTLLRDLDPTIGMLLGNLITIDGIAVRRLPGLRQILVEYPIVVAGGFTVAPGDDTAHFGLVLNLNNPPARPGSSGVRGSANAPGPTGSDPRPAPERGQPLGGPALGGPALGGQPAQGQPGQGLAAGSQDLVLGPDGLPLLLGTTGGQYQIAGDQSWKQLLLAGLQP